MQLLPANGSGASITDLNATNISSGTIATARLGSGTASSTTFLRGDNTWSSISVSAENVYGTGANPTAVPVTTSTGTLSVASTLYLSPIASTASSSLGSSALTILSTSAAPSFSIYSFNSNSITFTLYTVTNTAGTYSLGSSIGSCTTSGWSAGSPTSCSFTAPTSIAAGTLLTIVTSSVTATSAVWKTFSAQ
jgi:hypothetical protein